MFLEIGKKMITIADFISPILTRPSTLGKMSTIGSMEHALIDPLQMKDWLFLTLFVKLVTKPNKMLKKKPNKPQSLLLESKIIKSLKTSNKELRKSKIMLSNL